MPKLSFAEEQRFEPRVYSASTLDLLRYRLRWMEERRDVVEKEIQRLRIEISVSEAQDA